MRLAQARAGSLDLVQRSGVRIQFFRLSRDKRTAYATATGGPAPRPTDDRGPVSAWAATMEPDVAGHLAGRYLWSRTHGSGHIKCGAELCESGRFTTSHTSAICRAFSVPAGYGLMHNVANAGAPPTTSDTAILKTAGCVARYRCIREPHWVNSCRSISARVRSCFTS